MKNWETNKILVNQTQNMHNKKTAHLYCFGEIQVVLLTFHFLRMCACVMMSVQIQLSVAWIYHTINQPVIKTVKVQPYGVCVVVCDGVYMRIFNWLSVSVCVNEWVNVLTWFKSYQSENFLLSLLMHNTYVHMKLSLSLCVYIVSHSYRCVCAFSVRMCTLFLLFPIFIVIICGYWKRQSECAK